MTRLRTPSEVEVAFKAGWNARDTGLEWRKGGREKAFAMFESGFDFGDHKMSERLIAPSARKAESSRGGVEPYDP